MKPSPRHALALLLLCACEANVTIESKGTGKDPAHSKPTAPTGPPTDTGDTGTPDTEPVDSPPEDSAPVESSPDSDPPVVNYAPPVIVCPGAAVVEMSDEPDDPSDTPQLSVQVTDADSPDSELIVTMTLVAGARDVDLSGGVATYQFDPSERALGVQDVEVTARDQQGNSSNATCPFTGVDTSRPSLVNVAPASGATLIGAAVVTGLASDGFNTPNQLLVAVTIGRDDWYGTPLSDGTFSVPLTGLTGGEKNMEVRLTDTTGNVARVTWDWDLLDGIDITRPAPSDGYLLGELVEYEATATDAANLIDVTWTLYDPSGASTLLSTGTDLEISAIIGGVGAYTVEVEAEWSTGETGRDEVVFNVLDPDTLDEDGDSVVAADDCDDLDGSVGAATELYQDRDGDGYGWADIHDLVCPGVGWTDNADDCWDESAIVYPGASESCDYLDNDCNGVVDDGATDSQVWYEDDDGDLWGDVATAVTACFSPGSGWVLQAGDCDDGRDDMYPYKEQDCAAQIADNTDYNCDGSIGDMDVDLDGYTACYDCNDDDATVNPGHSESCAPGDNDCDSSTDEDDGPDAYVYYADGDADGYGDPAVTLTTCATLGIGGTIPYYDTTTGVFHIYRDDDSDCDDSLATVNPGNVEVCDSIDNDCDGQSDNTYPGISGGEWYQNDLDGDDYGDPLTEIYACEGASGQIESTLSLGIDCDDSSALAHVGLEEECDGLDNDCDGNADERLPDLEEPNDTQADATLIAVVADPTSGPSSGTYSLDELQLGDGETDWFYWDAKVDTLVGDPGLASLSVSVSGVAGPFTLNVWEADTATGTLASAASIVSTCDAASGLCTASVDDHAGVSGTRIPDGPIWYVEIVADPGWSCTTDTFSSTYTVSITY